MTPCSTAALFLISVSPHLSTSVFCESVFHSYLVGWFVLSCGKTGAPLHDQAAPLQSPEGTLTSCIIFSLPPDFMLPDTLSLMLFPLLFDFFKCTKPSPPIYSKKLSMLPYSQMLLCLEDLLPPCSSISHWLGSEFMLIPPVLLSEPDFSHAEGKAKSKMGRQCEEWFEEDGRGQLETKDAGEEAMERNNWASQNSQSCRAERRRLFPCSLLSYPEDGGRFLWSVNFGMITWSHIQEDSNLHCQSHENFTFHM